MRLRPLMLGLAIFLAACGDDGNDGPDTTTTPDTTTATDTTTSDTTTTPDTTTAPDTTAATDTTTATDTADDTSDDGDTSTTCATRAASVSGESGQSLIIEAVRFGAAQDVAVLRNVGASDVTITSAWQWCSRPAYDGIVDADTTIAPGDSLELALPFGVAAVDELAVYVDFDFGSADSIRAFVAWGGPPPEITSNDTRVGTATTAGLWEGTATFIPIAAGHDGFLANGTSSAMHTDAFTSVAPDCPLQ